MFTTINNKKWDLNVSKFNSNKQRHKNNQVCSFNKMSLKQAPIIDTFDTVSFKGQESEVIGEIGVTKLSTGENVSLNVCYTGEEILKTFLAPLIRAYGSEEKIPSQELKNKVKYETYKIFDPTDKNKIIGLIQLSTDKNITYPSGNKGAIHLAVLDTIEGRKVYHGLGTKLLQFAIEKSYLEGLNGRVYLEAIRLPYDQNSENPESFYRKFYFTMIPGSDYDEKLYYLPETYQQHSRCIDLKEEIKKNPIIHKQ